tara:strand:- start:563 stop:1594 length:1032 start_codon:yes stop_codon:yes gene_type:complete
MKNIFIGLLLGLPTFSFMSHATTNRLCIAEIEDHPNDFIPLEEHMAEYEKIKGKLSKITYLNAHLHLIRYLRVQEWIDHHLKADDIEIVTWMNQIMHDSKEVSSDAAIYLLSTANKNNIDDRVQRIYSASLIRPSILHNISFYRSLRDLKLNSSQARKLTRYIESNVQSIQWYIQSRLLLDDFPVPLAQLKARLTRILKNMNKELGHARKFDEKAALFNIIKLYGEKFKNGSTQAKEALIWFAESESLFSNFALHELYRLMGDDPLYLDVIKRIGVKNPMMITSYDVLDLIAKNALHDKESLHVLIKLSDSQSCLSADAEEALKKIKTRHPNKNETSTSNIKV